MNPAQSTHDNDDTKKAQPASDDPLAQAMKDAQANNDELEKLLKKIDELEEQLKPLKEASARAQAELQNAKMRMEKESSDLRKYASEGALIRLLPTIDNLQRAFKHLPQDLAGNEWVKGVVTIEQDFMKQLSGMGLQKMEALGQIADANKHEVLMEGAGEKGKILEVFEEGYELSGKVLRPAKVKVGAGV